MTVTAIFTDELRPCRFEEFMANLQQSAAPEFESPVMPRAVRLLRHTVPGPDRTSLILQRSWNHPRCSLSSEDRMATRPSTRLVLAASQVAALAGVLLTGCSLGLSDEGALRREFAIPGAARAITYQASPAESGWFGREGLRITMVFALSRADFDRYARNAERSCLWQPLPIPEAVLRHLAGTRTAVEARARQARESGQPLPAAGSVYNPSEEQILAGLIQSLPAQPPKGLYQIRTAGNDILRAPKTIRPTLNQDVNDFMLALLDPGTQTIAIRVSTNY